MQNDRSDVVNALKLARNFGTRIEEVVHLNKQQLREALKNNYLRLNITKGNIMRDVPIENDMQREALKEVMENAKNERIFINNKYAGKYDKDEQCVYDYLYKYITSLNNNIYVFYI